MKMIAWRRFTFDAAHYLPGYEGPCKNLHGHTWTLDVGIGRKLGEDEKFIIDFSTLKKLVQDKIIDTLDHQCINQIDELEHIYPSCENLARWIAMTLYQACYELLYELLPQGLLELTEEYLNRQSSIKIHVKLQEGDGGWITCQYPE